MTRCFLHALAEFFYPVLQFLVNHRGRQQTRLTPQFHEVGAIQATRQRAAGIRIDRNKPGTAFCQWAAWFESGIAQGLGQRLFLVRPSIIEAVVSYVAKHGVYSVDAGRRSICICVGNVTIDYLQALQ